MLRLPLFYFLFSSTPAAAFCIRILADRRFDVHDKLTATAFLWAWTVTALLTWR